jgi:hypothetical protein
MTVQGFDIWNSLEVKQRWGTNNTVLFHVQRPVRIITTARNKVRERILFLHYKYVRKNKNNIIWRIITCLILHSVISDFLQTSINCSSVFPQPASFRSVNITLSSSFHKLRNHIPPLSREHRYVSKPHVSVRMVCIPTMTQFQILLRRIVRIAYIPIRTQFQSQS